MPRFQAGCRTGGEGIVLGQLTCFHIKPKLIHRIRPGVRHKSEPIGGIGQNRVGAPSGLDLAQGILDHHPVPADGVAADNTAAVAGPEQRASGAIGGHIGGIGTNIGDAQWHECFFRMINPVRGNAVGRANGDVQTVAIGADALAAGRAGQVVPGALHEGSGLGV